MPLTVSMCWIVMVTACLTFWLRYLAKRTALLRFSRIKAMVHSSVPSNRLQENTNGVLLTSSIIMVCQVCLLLAISLLRRTIQVSLPYVKDLSRYGTGILTLR